MELKLPGGSPTPILDALASDEMKLRAWGISPQYRQAWLEVLEDALASRRTGTPIARTTIRNLRDLERTLRLGVRVDGETKRQLMQAMNLLAAQLSMD